MPAEEPLDRAVAEDVTALGQRRAQLLDGDVQRRLDEPLDQPALRFDAGWTCRVFVPLQVLV
jgi:hypothetical protein